MTKDLRVVLHTNLFVSILITKNGMAERALERAYMRYTFLYSDASMNELRDVLRRPKFERYATLAARERLIRLSFVGAKRIEIRDRVTDCVDAKDNKFLELALSGRADLILTGDDHLLRLGPWRGVAILTPRAFLELAG
jgi:putative PIN family toxin of toxin-antitoxin system